MSEDPEVYSMLATDPAAELWPIPSFTGLNSITRFRLQYDLLHRNPGSPTHNWPLYYSCLLLLEGMSGCQSVRLL